MTAIILVLVIITIVTIFSVQNATPVAITFLFWKFEASLAIVIFISMIAGALVSAVIYYSARISRSVKKDA